MSGTQLNLTGYKLTFDDQFADDTNAGIGLPGTPGIKWETEPFYKDTSNGGNPINPTPPGQPGSLFSLQNGMLVENMNTSQSPYLDTNPNGVPGGFSQQYGYFEVSAKLVGTSGYNSDFWMMPNSGPWPPEFDVYEHNGYIAGDYEMTNHGGDASTPAQNLDLYNVPNLTTSFNTFGFQWTPTTLTWYINGQAVFSAPTASNENQPFNMIISGGPSNGVPWLPPPLAGSSDQYDIQWAHAYSNDPNATAIAGMAGYQDHDGSTSLGGTSAGGSTSGSGSTGSTGSTGGGTQTASNYITPGIGSFTDSAGNVYTLTADDIAMENSSAIPGGGGTGAMEYANGIVYAQDQGSGTWYTWNQSTFSLASSPPPTPSGSTGGTTSGGTTSPPPPPPPTTPDPVTAGTGSDQLVLKISEDAYQGDAQFTVSVDGKQVGGTFTATAAHAAGLDQTFTLNGDWAVGAHTVAVNFLNDAWGGTATTDRNLYVDGVTYDGTNTGQSATFLVSGPQNFAVTDSTPLPGTTPPPPPPSTAPVPLVVPGAGSFTDAAGNVYTIDSAHNSMENGNAIPGGDGTGAMEYANGTVYAADFGSGTWYTWNQSTFTKASSSPPANTTGGQSPTTLTLTASQTAETTIAESNIVISATAGAHNITVQGTGNVMNMSGGNETISALSGKNSIVTGAGSDKITFAGSGNTIDAGAGMNTLADQGSGNTIIMASIGSKDTISGKVLTNGDKLDFTNALKATNWDGAASDLRGYLRVASDNAGGSLVRMSATKGGSFSTIADLRGTGSISLSTLLAHSVT